MDSLLCDLLNYINGNNILFVENFLRTLKSLRSLNQKIRIDESSMMTDLFKMNH